MPRLTRHLLNKGIAGRARNDGVHQAYQQLTRTEPIKKPLKSLSGFLLCELWLRWVGSFFNRGL